jgi:hypothetical protein
MAMSPPFCCLSLVTSAVTSPLTIVELSQSAFSSVEEKTYLRMLLKTSRRAEGIGGGRDSSPAYGGSSSGRNPSRNERSRTWET